MDDLLSKPLSSVAMTEHVDRLLREYLVRPDHQEDLCFALYRASRGERRFSALLVDLVQPQRGDRQVHGNASFNPQYFERALSKGISEGMGVALLHTHPGASSWQPMSASDRDAEEGMAAAVRGATSLPLVGLTLSGRSGFWSARHWFRQTKGQWSPRNCENVRVVGSFMTPSSCKPSVEVPISLKRTTHAWGREFQERLSSIRVGVVGLGSVGALVGEALARMGITDMVFIDLDTIKAVNLDRTLHAYPEQVAVADSKAMLAGRSAARSATMPNFQMRCLPIGIQDLRAYRAALDCDVLFSCVDRPWPRSILNHLAYANLIPVIDGGINVSQVRKGGLRSADWGVFVVGPSRRCLECAGQYSSGLVSVEQAGDLDEPSYFEQLPLDSPLRQRENVFAFSMGLASSEVLKLAQLLGLAGRRAAPNEERYVYPASLVEIRESQCHENCSVRSLVGCGDDAGHPGTETWP